MNMKISLLLFSLVFSLLSFAQPENAEIEVINGKRYYVHMVQGGNTLYGIHKLYNVSVEEIIAANPESANGLAEGQRILVPIKGIESLPVNIVIHKVESKETLYGISKKYETTVEKLVELNPGIELGLQEGQEIKVPVTLPVGKGEPLKEKQEQIKISFTDSIIEHIVMKGETLYSISKRFMVPVNDLKSLNGMRNDRVKPGDIIKIPVKKERIEKVKIREVLPVEKPKTTIDSLKLNVKPADSVVLFKKKESYNVAILLPLSLDQQPGYSAAISNLAAEYYMGTKFALDSLKALGFKAKVYIHDSKNDSTSVMAILSKPEFKEVDLIIGPFFGSNSEYVSKWSKEHGVRMICPVATSYEILRNNPYVYESVTSDITLTEGLAKYVMQKEDSAQIILIKPSSASDQLIYEGFRNSFNSLRKNKESLPKIIETTLEDFATFVLPNKNSAIVFLSTNKGEVGTLMASLAAVSEKNVSGVISVYGTKDWENYSNLESEHLMKFNVHFATPYDLNYKNARTKNFDKAYRAEYRTQVSKMALQGYDVTMYFCQSLLMGKNTQKGIMNDFHIEQKGEGNGYENTACFIMKHNDYGFKKIFEIHD
jgi:LysM repeat protein